MEDSTQEIASHGDDNNSETKQGDPDTKADSEIILAPSDVQLTPLSSVKPDKVVLKSVSEPLPRSSRYNGRHWRLRKHFSEPVFLGDEAYRTQRSTFHDNPAFDPDDTVPSNPTFADVVRQVINEPIAEDIHPYGRGHLYATALKLDLPKIHQEEGSLFMWLIATAVILGLVFAVIFMSVMYEPPLLPKASVTQSTGLNTTQTQYYNTT